MAFGARPNDVIDIGGLFQALLARMNSGRSTSGAQPEPQFGMGMPETLPAPRVARDVNSHEMRNRQLPAAPAPGLDFPSRPDTMVPLSESPYRQEMAPQGMLSPSHEPNAPISAHMNAGKELPYQTYERLTGNKWHGGQMQDAYSNMGITAAPGRAEANLALQQALLRSALNDGSR